MRATPGVPYLAGSAIGRATEELCVPALPSRSREGLRLRSCVSRPAVHPSEAAGSVPGRAQSYITNAPRRPINGLGLLTGYVRLGFDGDQTGDRLMDLVPTVMLTFRPEFVPLLRGNQNENSYCLFREYSQP